MPLGLVSVFFGSLARFKFAHDGLLMAVYRVDLTTDGFEPDHEYWMSVVVSFFIH